MPGRAHLLVESADSLAVRPSKDARTFDRWPTELELVAEVSLDAVTVSASLRGGFASTLANFIWNHRNRQATASHIFCLNNAGKKMQLQSAACELQTQ